MQMCILFPNCFQFLLAFEMWKPNITSFGSVWHLLETRAWIFKILFVGKRGLDWESEDEIQYSELSHENSFLFRLCPQNLST